MGDKEYLEREFLQVCPFPVKDDAKFSIKIESENGRFTRWITINAKQFKALERALIDNCGV